MFGRIATLDLTHKASLDGNDAFPCFDVRGGRDVFVQAKTVKEYANRELLEKLAALLGTNEQIFSRIRLLETVAVSNIETAAKSIKTLESQMRGTEDSVLNARVSTVETTYASKTYAEAKKTEAITASAADAQARVDIESSARAGADGHLEGKYTLKVTTGNVVTGMNITSSTGGGEDVSSVVFNAADFKVYNGTSGVAPFQVTGGQVRVNSLVLVPGDISGLGDLATEDSVTYASITGTKPPTDADSTSGVLLGGVNINSGGVTLSGTASIKSSSYSAGSAGWAIKADGSVEFNNGTYRGAIDVGTGANKVSITSSGFTVGSGWGDGYSSNMALRSGGFTLVNGGTVAMYTDFTGSTGSGLLVIGGTQIMGAGSGQITTGSITAGSIDIP